MKKILNIIGKFYNIDPFQFGLMVVNLLVPIFLLGACVHDSYFNLSLLGISFLPFFVSFFLFIARVEFKKKKWVRILTDVLSALLMIPFFMFHIVLIFTFSISYIIDEYPTNDVSQYKRLRVNEEYLPKKIPENAYDVQMYYTMGFLQGGTYLILYYKTDEEEIQNYIDKYDDLKDYVEEEAVNILGNRKYYNTPYENGLSDDFEKYQIYVTCDDSGYCNHGRDKHYAINYNTKEIIFYYGTW